MQSHSCDPDKTRGYLETRRGGAYLRCSQKVRLLIPDLARRLFWVYARGSRVTCICFCSEFEAVEEIKNPGTLEGGDVLAVCLLPLRRALASLQSFS